ncbi:MAG TPA: response regulator [Candidatus Acidoferrum sp.]
MSGHECAEVIQILHLEDSLAYQELVRELLVRGGIQCEVFAVSTREEFASALQVRKCDIILADYSLPGFDGVSALRTAQQFCPDVPFLFLSGVIGEDVGGESLKSGATDYLLKQSIKYLRPAVERALQEAEIRAEQTIRDPLTRLYNRRYLEDSLHREVSRARRVGSKVGCRQLQAVQRLVWTSDRRRTASLFGQLPEITCTPGGYPFPVWRRGIRPYFARNLL